MAMKNITDNTISLCDSRITYMGRTFGDESSVKMSWSGTGFEMAVRGGTVKANISGPDASEDEAVWMAVYVNGKRMQKFALKEELDEWYTLADNLPDDHITIIKVVKLSEASWGTATLKGITVTGILVEYEPPARRILCIGDSITCGFGVLGMATDSFSTKTEDVTLTCGWLLAEAFHAQCHVISVSGYGLVTANTGSTTDVLPRVYPYTALGETKLWNHERYQPDLILVNLGTNDEFMHIEVTALRRGVSSFLSDLRNVHPDSTIVWIYGLMQEGFKSEIQTETEIFAREDEKVYFLPMNIAMNDNELGAACHPSDKAHARAAQALQPSIADIMGW